MREFAFMQLENDDPGVTPEAQEEFDEEIALAEEGRWDDLDLDTDPLPASI